MAKIIYILMYNIWLIYYYFSKSIEINNLKKNILLIETKFYIYNKNIEYKI